MVYTAGVIKCMIMEYWERTAACNSYSEETIFFPVIEVNLSFGISNASENRSKLLLIFPDLIFLKWMQMKLGWQTVM